MGRTLKFYGASDDLFEIEGSTGDEPDEINCFDAIPSVRLVHSVGETGLVVTAVYGVGKAAVWSIGIAPLDEDMPLPDWPVSFKLGGRGYSAEMTIEVPDGVEIQQPSFWKDA